MKIAVVGHNFVVRENQKQLDELVSIDLSLDLVLITAKWWNENTRKTYLERKDGAKYPIYSLPSFFTGHNTLAFYIRGLANLLSAFKPDVIEVYEEPWSLFLLQVILIKKIFRLKTKIVCYSAQNIKKKFPFPFNVIERYNFKNVDAIHICSDGIKTVLTEKGYRGLIKKIPLGIDLSKFEFNPKKPTSKLVIGCVGRIVEAKGVFDLVESIKQIDNCQLIFCGSGSDEAKLKKFVQEQGLTDKVLFRGSLSFDQLIEFYQNIDVLVVPSKTTKTWKEQFGRIIVEAYSCGSFVIGSDSGSIPEIIDNYGLVFKEGDVSDLVNKIKEVQDDPERKLSIRREAESYVIDTFTWAKVAESYVALYREVYENRG
jgi:glycosyltransferase involved in cell wall biosynthesis